MILTGPEIHRQIGLGRIIIEPYDPANINPNSYNFHLGRSIKIYDEAVLDPSRPNAFHEIEIPKSGLMLRPERLYLGHIEEQIGSEWYVPIMRGRSSIGRLGIFINITSDLVDLGAIGRWTMQLHAVQPARIYTGMSIGQMTFWEVLGKRRLYHGKYQGATGPGESLAHRDFNVKT
jgi:dCTP deaminase